MLAGDITAYGDKNHIVYISPFGESRKINKNSKKTLPSGGRIIVSRKPLNELELRPDRFQQISSIITSLVTIAILANSTSNNN